MESRDDPEQHETRWHPAAALNGVSLWRFTVTGKTLG